MYNLGSRQRPHIASPNRFYTTDLTNSTVMWPTDHRACEYHGQLAFASLLTQIPGTWSEVCDWSHWSLDRFD